MHALIATVQAGNQLTQPEASEAVARLVDPGVDAASKAAFLTALRAKGETAAEMARFVEAMLRHAVDPLIEPSALQGPLLDVCGTGGDKMHLFNVSTASMFVIAAGGAAVVKHGNRAITSQCGGADVLEALGVRIELPPADLKRCVESLGLGFVFAPAYHPAFKVIGPIRKSLAAQGIPTIFNLLGPLLNPARPSRQLVGVFDLGLLPKYAAALQLLGRERAWAVHGAGLDELSTCASSDVIDVGNHALRSFQVDPRSLGLPPSHIEDLRGGNCAENAAILEGILRGAILGPKRAMVALNAAGGFVVAGLAPDLVAGMAIANEQIDSGRALAKLQALQGFH